MSAVMTEDEGLSTQIFLQYRSRIYSYINSKCVSPSDRDDVFGEIILKISAYAERYDSDRASLSTWVYMICRSVVTNYFNKRRPECGLDENLESGFDLEYSVEIKDELRALAARLDTLPDRDRKVIVLRLYKDMEYSEIAGAMRLSEGNVRVIYSRALKKLRETYLDV